MAGGAASAAGCGSRCGTCVTTSGAGGRITACPCRGRAAGGIVVRQHPALHAIADKPMPEGWVVHSETGKPITDPKKVSEGVLLPIGGHKGGGLALIIGLLA